ncbi:hypothetical protein B0T18DRAFT_410279 [Schizothecium vesticola]|uniref:Uncharacterized protein n=1 Tax=Schizothecium vesticola TaxID=314040 RepID=A0AA40K4Q7_9PEZI|nr:hypothetical protein B0T18DRAFT_410279 [Schizothecium vesticola]
MIFDCGARNRRGDNDSGTAAPQVVLSTPSRCQESQQWARGGSKEWCKVNVS